MKNKLILIGTAGKADELSLRAIERLQNAGVILYEGILSEKITQFLPVDALKINVGPAEGLMHQSLQRSNHLVISYASIYKSVVRLHTDESFIFGRALHEIFYAGKHGIEVELIPAFSTLSRINGLSRYTLTQLAIASGFRFVYPSKTQFAQQIEQGILSDKPLIVPGGISEAETIVRTFFACGKKNASVLIIRNDDGIHEKMLVTTLHDLVSTIYEEQVDRRAILVIGLGSFSENPSLKTSFDKLEGRLRVFN